MIIRLGFLGFYFEFGKNDDWVVDVRHSFRPRDDEYAIHVRVYPIWLSFGWSKYCFPYCFKINPCFPIGF